MRSCIVVTDDGKELKVDLTSLDFLVEGRTTGSDTDVSDTSDSSDSFADPGLCAALMKAIDSADTEELLRPSDERSEAAKRSLKEVVESLGDASQALHVDGFDAEQIWVQLDGLSRAAMRRVKRVLQRSADLDSVIPADVEEALDELLDGRSGAEDDEGERGEGDGENWEDSDKEDDDDDDDGEEDSKDEETEETEETVRGQDRQRASWEDDYLNMDEMEAFLRDAEDEYARETGDGEGSDGDPDEEALDGVLDDMMNRTGRSRGGRKRDVDELGDVDVDIGSDPLANAKYDDFFEPVRAGGKDKKKKQKKKRVHFIEAEDTDGESEDNGEDDDGDRGGGDGDGEDSDVDSEFADDQFEGDRESVSDDDDDDDDAGDDDDDDDGEDPQPASRHQLRLDCMSNRIQKLEDDALGEREWFMRGEVSGSHRPMNSALEVDLDFETTMKPPPQPTEETTQSLEDLIKQRIADHQFDDVVPIIPAKEEKKKTTVELDDVKSTQGLGQIYEDEYLAQTRGASEDKEQPIRDLAKKQFIDLCAKLDQLSHGQFKPLPAIEEVTFKVDVPAIMMEEATPVFVSDASMRRPEEVFKPGQSLHKSIVEVDDEGEERVVTKREGMMQAGVAKSEAELTREDRKRRRAAKKRASKKRRSNADAERIQRSLAAGTAVVTGRKSAESAQMLRKLASTAKESNEKSFKSREVFARMNDLRDGTRETDKGSADKGGQRAKTSHLKL